MKKLIIVAIVLSILLASCGIFVLPVAPLEKLRPENQLARLRPSPTATLEAFPTPPWLPLTPTAQPPTLASH